MCVSHNLSGKLDSLSFNIFGVIIVMGKYESAKYTVASETTIFEFFKSWNLCKS